MATWTFGRRVQRADEGDALDMPSAAWPILRAALRHPGMIPDLLSASWVFRRRDWYRRVPFLPVPSAAFLRWRLETAYGDPDAVPPTEDVRRFLRWARMTRRGMTFPSQESLWAD